MNQQKQIQIAADGETLKGRYSNFARVSHMPEEFVLDFFSIVAGQGALVSRVVVSPGHLKRMIKAFQGNLERYEKKFGSVEEAEEPEAEIGFKAD